MSTPRSCSSLQVQRIPDSSHVSHAVVSVVVNPQSFLSDLLCFRSFLFHPFPVFKIVIVAGLHVSGDKGIVLTRGDTCHDSSSLVIHTATLTRDRRRHVPSAASSIDPEAVMETYFCHAAPDPPAGGFLPSNEPDSGVSSAQSTGTVPWCEEAADSIVI